MAPIANAYTFSTRQFKKKNTLVSGNAGDEKNLHPGGRKFIFFNQFNWIFQIKFALKELL